MTAHSGIENIADTARWVALYRAAESERPDALFRDVHARRLAGARGAQILATLPRPMRNAAWSVTARTVLFDRLILQQMAEGVTLVVNLAAGLDTRPYRLAFPAGVTWVEVDQAALLEEKTALLTDAEPQCRLERIPVDLAQDGPRRALFQQLGQRAERTLILTEGLVMYLPVSTVAALADDLAAIPTVQSWITDLISPGLLRMIDKSWGAALRSGGAAMHFAPPEGAAFFAPHGWRTAETHATFTAARQLRRLPWLLHLFSFLPGSDRYHPDRPWSGVVLLQPDRQPGGVD